MSDKTNDGGPAFPHPEYVEEYSGGARVYVAQPGMSVRMYLAAKAMQALIARRYDTDMRGMDGWREEFGMEALRFADGVLLAESTRSQEARS